MEPASSATGSCDPSGPSPGAPGIASVPPSGRPSWSRFTQIYPPLSRRRSLALELKGLDDAGYADTLDHLDPRAVTRTLDALTSQLVTARIDFTQHTETYYFQEEDPRLSLARQVRVAVRIQSAAQSSASPDVALSATRLRAALDELSATLQDGFLRSADDDDVFEAYASDHGRRRNDS